MAGELNPLFVERVLQDLGSEEGRALCEALDGPSPVAVRLHPDKVAGEDWTRRVAELPALRADRPVPWCPTGLYLAERPSFTADTDFHAGAYYVQEPASQFVGYLLSRIPMQGASVLDFCAAPGGKTTLYASLVGAEGCVVANEIDRRRAAVLADNVRKWGTGNVAVTLSDGKFPSEFDESFDVVAVDAPCSGEGMFRKDLDARDEWSEANVSLCAHRQDEILHDAWRLLRPGGTLIYSTCTFNRLEDEGSLERMLAWAGDEVEAAELPEVDASWGIVCGEVGPFATFRFYPHKACGEGFFAAVARKAGEADADGQRIKVRKTRLQTVDRATAREAGRWLEGEWQFVTTGEMIYAWPSAHEAWLHRLSTAVPVIYSGVAMGQIFKGVLKPDGALAFATRLCRGVLPEAELDEVAALQYLRRGDVPVTAFAEGMNLVTARGRALGFAKRIGARVNNLYPNSLRIIKI